MPTDLQPLTTDYGPAREDANAFADATPPTRIQPIKRADTSGTQRTPIKSEKSKLITMKTDFRTLKYGGDQRNGGTSGQPYIRTALDRSLTSPIVSEYTKRPGLNGIALYSTIDKDRIGRFLANNTQGRLFAAKQRNLLLANPKMEVGTNFNSVSNANAGILQSIINNAQKGGALEYTRVYNDNRSLLQQVGASGTGLHLDYPGQSASTPFQAKYNYIVKNKTKEQNRLVILYGNKIEQTRFRGVNDVSPAVINELNKLGISRSQNKLFEYVGGPSSGGEATWSTIKRYDYTTTWARFSSYSSTKIYNPGTGSLANLLPRVNTNFIAIPNRNAPEFAGGAELAEVPIVLKRGVAPGGLIKGQFAPIEYDPSNQEYSLNHRAYSTSSFIDNDTPISPINRAKAMSYDQMMKSSISLNTGGVIAQDFRIAADSFPNTNNYEGDTTGVGYQAKVYGVGNPGNALQKKVSYGAAGYSSAQADSGVDQVNLLDVGSDYTDGIRDLITCKISAVETQQNIDNLNNVVVPLIFRAFISNFSDNINANYNEFQYVGRGEKFYTYNSSDRKISFQLAISAQSRVEMKPLYRKLNYLISQLYPAYSGRGDGTGNGFLRAPLVKMTIGDYLSDQPGFLTGINISVPQEASWEIKADPKEQDIDMYQLPQYMTLNINFTPIHNFIARRAYMADEPGVGKVASIPSFITPNEGLTTGGTRNIFGIGQ